MTLHLLLLAAAAATNAAPAPAEPARQAPPGAAVAPCRAGPPEPTTFSTLRDNQTAVCAYDVNDLYRRLGAIISSPDAQISMESAARVFGLPPMESSYDSSRQASYTTILYGADGWKLRLWLRESAYPLDETLPPAFTPGVRPTRLADIDTLDVRYDITITLPAGADTPERCMTAADAAALALAGGWTDDTVRSAMMVTDFGQGSPSYLGKDGQHFAVFLRKQAGTLPTEAEMKGECVTRALFMQPPKKLEKQDGPASDLAPLRPAHH